MLLKNLKAAAGEDWFLLLAGVEAVISESRVEELFNTTTEFVNISPVL